MLFKIFSKLKKWNKLLLRDAKFTASTCSRSPNPVAAEERKNETSEKKIIRQLYLSKKMFYEPPYLIVNAAKRVSEGGKRVGAVVTDA